MVLQTVHPTGRIANLSLDELRKVSMELPSRPKNDRYTKPGRYTELENRLRNRPDVSEISTIVAYSFDHRTRLGPFLCADMRLLTAGPRAVAASLINAGFTRTRI